MAKNTGKIDHGGRMLVAALLLVMAFGTSVLGGGMLLWLAVIVTGIFTISALAGNCPPYSIVGLKSSRDCCGLFSVD